MARISRQFFSVWMALVLIAVVGIVVWASTDHPWALLVLLVIFVLGIGIGELWARARSFFHGVKARHLSR